MFLYILDFYFKCCSVLASCKDLAKIALVFANHGVDIKTGEQLIPSEYAKYVNATLATCGMYDGSGEFALEVGFPAKSGVGGGLLSVVDKLMGLGIYSPALDLKGNCIAGRPLLEYLSKELKLHIFDRHKL